MGYAKPNQDAGGIHLRQYSRTIIIQDLNGKRILYNSIDNGMISQLMRTEVLKRLALRFGPSVYNESNVMMSASHSHSCPGGFFQYMLYNIPSAGFISQTLHSLVDGIVLSVEKAHDSVRMAKIYYTEGELIDASVNRSPQSYLNNPQEERLKYKYDTDKTMQLLKIVDKATNEPFAMINWFPVHGTSMNNTNHLISSDNKGYASLLFEEEFNPVGTLPGKGKFVALFAQANEGDVSPNTKGPRCIDTGLPCDAMTSTCGNPPRNEKCIAFGPGKDMFESTKIIAHKQYQKARQLFLSSAKDFMQIRGPVRYIHEHIDMTKQVVPLYKNVIDLARRQRQQQLQRSDGQLVSSFMQQVNSSYHTCQAGLGYSFAAGTTDGPGAFDFQQADTASGRYWNMVRDFLRKPTTEQVKCHQPKPILLSTGEMDFPYMWHPRIIPTQIIMVGQFAIVGLPGEFTTMAGRRVRETVANRLKNGAEFGSELDEDLEEEVDDNNEHDDKLLLIDTNRFSVSTSKSNRKKRAYSLAPKIKVALSGLSNIYSSYITTLEEYQLQRYEGASTLYGPHTLQAYINQFSKLAEYLIEDQPLPENSSHLQPPDLTKSLFSFKTGVLFDGTQMGKHFGDVLKDVDDSRVFKCQELVEVDFVAGNPRNDLRHGDSFLYIDKYTSNGTWLPIATDSSWDTKFIWERTNTILGESRARIIWDIPHDCKTGLYRIRYYGASKSLLQNISQYSGQSKIFKVSGTSSSSTTDVKQEDLDYLNNLMLEATRVPSKEPIMLTGDDINKPKRSGSDDDDFVVAAANSNSAHKPQPTQRAPFYSALGSMMSWFRNRL